MATVTKNITLDKSILRSKSMNASCLWIIETNILNLNIPEGYSFRSINIVWHSLTDSCTAYAFFVNGNSVDEIMIGLKRNNKPFSDFEELRKAYPKLFKAKGELMSINTNTTT